MRLIDADKLTINCFCVNRICVDGRTIENAPTVEAIPVEWIEDYVTDHWRTTKLYATNYVSEMVEEWVKENENN